jgi:5'-deoxynucleotidase YfbR-like HD superfamily hydrolase
MRRTCAVCARLFRVCVFCGKYLDYFNESSVHSNLCQNCRAALLGDTSERERRAIELAKRNYTHVQGLKTELEQVETENRRLKSKLKKITRKKWK